MKRAQLVLKIFLRINAVVMALAMVAVIMPGEWVFACHRWLGLGEFPNAPIAGYLARSLSAFYAFTGGLLWMVSSDIERYRRVIGYLGIMGLIFGPLLVVIDFRSGLPIYWSLSEGPVVFLLSLVLLGLLRKINP